MNTYDSDKAPWLTTKKTVYDPCPPGFQMPSYNIFSGFSRDGNEARNGSGLNIFPDAEGQKSAATDQGGYFFVDPYDADNFDRYNKTVYMPATGEYHGNKNYLSKMSEAGAFFDNSYGIYWTADYVKEDDSKAPALWLAPDWTYQYQTSKPAYGTGLFACYSSLRQVRPVKTP